ncbi:hypothetical protein SLEP1_g57528 [Rubroshorea leprosula]|uniref:Uncharacterized protein n=1 Tax=Rubroshorea leprosula TaxID=152421 RepID=A0AAV5MLV0_9ROSI|nr:hypothetical protein SLEP1_g57528 [Rubroshorea leprosula]
MVKHLFPYVCILLVTAVLPLAPLSTAVDPLEVGFAARYDSPYSPNACGYDEEHLPSDGLFGAVDEVLWNKTGTPCGTIYQLRCISGPALTFSLLSPQKPMPLSRIRPKIQSKSNSSSFERVPNRRMYPHVGARWLRSGCAAVFRCQFLDRIRKHSRSGKAVRGAEERLAGKLARKNWGRCLT